MTIKPAAKRAPPDTDGNIENPSGGGVTGDPNNHGQQKSPQRRELYEDLSRHRCSPNKSRNKRRDHLHEHHKRERVSERSERNKHATEVTNSVNATVQRSLGVGNMLLSNSAAHSLVPNMNVAGGAGVVGRNSPAAINDVSVNVAAAAAAAAAAANMLAVAGNVGGNNVVGNLSNVSGSGGVGVGIGGIGVVGSSLSTPARDHHHSSSTVTVTATSNVNCGVGGVNGTNATNMLQGVAITNHGIKSIEESCSGYNSGDEHMPPKEKTVSAAEWKRRDEQFVRVMAEAGFEVRQVEEDGACLFRSISLQIYGDEDAHEIVRQHTMDYIYKNREYFSQFVTEDINSYITRKRRKDSHGNHIEIQAMSEIYARPVEVYCYKSKPINIFNSEQQRNGYAPLRLSYQRMSHYNAIIDPYNATVGVGLGIANYHPTMQTKEAMRMSEQLEIEQTMFEDKLKTTDWEATNEVIEEQVARESYLQWCRENLQKNRVAAARSATATVTSAQASSSEIGKSTSLDEIASPSKYVIESSSGSGNNSSSNSSSSNHSPQNSESGVGSAAVPSVMSSATRKLNFLIEKQQNTAGSGNGNGNENSGGGSGSVINVGVTVGATSPGSTTATTTAAKKLTALAKLQKEANVLAAAAVSASSYDSDDTDISTNSSLADVGGGIAGVAGRESPMRSKKIKTRYISKKRRHEQLMRHNDGNESSGGGHYNISVDGSGIDGSSNSGSGSDATPRVHKGAKRDNAPMETNSRYVGVINTSIAANTGGGVGGAGLDVDVSGEEIEKSTESKLEELPCSSKCVQQPAGGCAAAVNNIIGNMDTGTGVTPLSSFYQDLLESSYDTDGFGQLTEAEMLQRAIQLSTQDYIEHQKRKYLFRP